MEECITGQAGLVAVRESMPLRPGRAGSSLVVRLVLLALKDKGGLAVEAYVFGDGFCAAQVGEEREGDGWCDMQSRRRHPAEIGKGTDYIEVAVFTGDFIEGHGGRLKTPFGGFRRPLAFVGS